MATQPQLVPTPSRSTPVSAPPQHAARGFAQVFGIHPAIAFLTLIVDTMLFGSEGIAVIGAPLTAGASVAASLMVSTAVAGVVGFIAYKAQQRWYGDDSESAAIKALILAVLIAIPTNIPSFVYLPSGLLGFFGRKKS